MEDSEEVEPATTRLLRRWAQLDVFCHQKLRPALAANDAVVTDGFGLDALLYAMAFERGCKETPGLHHGLVHLRLQQQGVSPPEYFIFRGDKDCTRRCILEKHPDLESKPTAVDEFIDFENNQIANYFDPRTGQKRPSYIDPNHGLAQVADSIMGIIGHRMEERRLN